MKEIKVLQLIDSLSVGGAEVLAVNIANILGQYDEVDSYLCATRQEGFLKRKIRNVDKYLFLDRKKSIDIKALLKLRNYVTKHSINIIHAHSSSYFIAFCLKICKPSVKIIWHDHYGKSDFLDLRKRQPLRFISRFFSTVIVVNNNLLKWGEENLLTKKIYFFKNFVYLDNQDKVTKLNGIDGKRIVHLAAFRPQKDHLNLLTAFLKVLVYYPDWSLHLVGKGNNDAYEASIHEFVKLNKLESSVFFYGVCADISNILEQSSVGVLSSNSEGLPVSLLEYGISKLPVIITDVGECGDIVKQVNSSFLVPKLDNEALSKAMVNLIKLSEEEKTLFGEELYKLIVEEYSHSQFMGKLIKIYSNC